MGPQKHQKDSCGQMYHLSNIIDELSIHEK